MENGRVSVIIPTYNRPRWLPETIESVLNQTYSDVELIVVNDGSTDNTEEVIESYRDKIRYIYKQNGGPGSAVNRGIEESTGEYIARVDDDDLFMPEKVEIQVGVFQENPDVGLVASGHHIIDTEGNILHTKSVPDFSKHGGLITMLRHCIFSQPTVMVRKECYDKVGLYKNTYAQDYDMWIRIARCYPMKAIDKPLAMYRRHDENRSGKESRKKVTNDIRGFIKEAMDDISIEEMFPELNSVPHAHDVRGAIFLSHEIFKEAGKEFYTAAQMEPNNMIHPFWLGILLRRIGRYETAVDCFKQISSNSNNGLHELALKALDITERFEATDPEDEEAWGQVRRDSFEEYDELMDMTMAIIKGEGF
ncbi:glycosyltransferase [Candidatus Poribacteria bacterium]|nr:glycosyltransferase [Candidatus Poribacteria bacterium]